MSPTPSRREALRLLGTVPAIGFAGCLSSRSRPAGGRAPTDVDTPPQTTGIPANLEFSVDVLQSFTDDHPGRITVALSNDLDAPLMMGITHGIEGPLSVIEGSKQDGDAKLIILVDDPDGDLETPPGAPCASDGAVIPGTPVEGCWRPACEFATMVSHYPISIPAGETIEREYVVLDGFNDRCLPAGTYAFEETSPVATTENAAESGDTPTGGYSHLLTKRVSMTLASDGSLTVESRTAVEPHGVEASESSTKPTPVRASTATEA